MSDRPYNAPQEGGMGADLLDEALAPQDESARYEPPQPSQPPQQEPQQPPRRQGGMAPLIKAKRKEILELEKKIETHEETGVYAREQEDGRTIFDYVAMQIDQTKLQRLNRELSELRERERSYAETAQTRSQMARQMARDLLERELQRVPEKMRRPIGEAFASIFRAMDDAGEWSKAAYSDRNGIRNVLDQMFDTAYGHALRRAEGAGNEVRDRGAPPPSGYDEEDEPETRESDEPPVDDFTNNLMYAYDQRKRGSMTVAEAKRAAREAAAQKGGQR